MLALCLTVTLSVLQGAGSAAETVSAAASQDASGVEAATGTADGVASSGVVAASQSTLQTQAEPPPTLRQSAGLGLESGPHPLPLSEAFPYRVTAVTAIGAQHLRITWQIAPEHYLYHHGFNFRLSDDSPEQSSIRFTIPQGIAKHDQFFGDVTVYYDSVSIDLFLPASPILSPPPSRKRAPQQPRSLLIHYQGCADWGFCYPPQQDEYSLGAAE